MKHPHHHHHPNKDSRRGFGSEAHEVPSGPNPISNRVWQRNEEMGVPWEWWAVLVIIFMDQERTAALEEMSAVEKGSDTSSWLTISTQP
ncbi:hypothetical protein PIB30_069610 [Stylosanthes scabra]|uniref:Uncharacterized protein n=1 Tax=Stylosanthes scabra TaxID=79078 RepID=A0ABU6RN79_9FABA|nr:hypothetical protein [Stylosanthes scabra]